MMNKKFLSTTITVVLTLGIVVGGTASAEAKNVDTGLGCSIAVDTYVVGTNATGNATAGGCDKVQARLPYASGGAIKYSYGLEVPVGQRSVTGTVKANTAYPAQGRGYRFTTGWSGYRF